MFQLTNSLTLNKQSGIKENWSFLIIT